MGGPFTTRINNLRGFALAEGRRGSSRTGGGHLHGLFPLAGLCMYLANVCVCVCMSDQALPGSDHIHHLPPSPPQKIRIVQADEIQTYDV